MPRKMFYLRSYRTLVLPQRRHDFISYVKNNVYEWKININKFRFSFWYFLLVWIWYTIPTIQPYNIKHFPLYYMWFYCDLRRIKNYIYFFSWMIYSLYLRWWFCSCRIESISPENHHWNYTFLFYVWQRV